MDNDFDEFFKKNSDPEDEIYPESVNTDEPANDGFVSAQSSNGDASSDDSNVTFHFTSEDILQDEPEQQEEQLYETESPAQSGFSFGEAPEQRRPESQPYTPYRSEPIGTQTNYRASDGQPVQPPQQPYNFGRPYGPQNQPQRPPQSPQKKSKGGLIAVIVIVVVAVAVACTFLGSKLFSASPSSTNKLSEVQSTTVEAQREGTTSAIQYAEVSKEGALSAVEIAEKCRPSVVGVMTYVNGQLEGEGSGVVMGFDSDNTHTYIMTCAHVISSSGVTYGILTLDGSNFTAELVGYDSKTDIGVLKVEGTDFTVAQFADSTKLKIGETVYAIGNPGGSEYFGSMTEGIVSAIDRNVSGSYNITCIQHDAAINPGNSGGALVNSSGLVVGINSSKIADTDYEGMGFAVPSATATSIANSLISYGYVPNRPKLGITYSSVSNYQVYSMVVAIKGLPSGSLIITGISEDSALANTDAEVGDMIIKVNGKDMETSDVLLDLIDKGAVGDSLTLTLCRVNSRTYQTSTFDITIKLVEDKGSSAETTTESDSIYDFGNNGGNGGSGAFGRDFDFGDFFKDYFGF